LLLATPKFSLTQIIFLIAPDHEAVKKASTIALALPEESADVVPLAPARCRPPKPRGAGASLFLKNIQVQRGWPLCTWNGPHAQGAIFLFCMDTLTQYREFAETCERLAMQEKFEHRRDVLMEMAQVWRQLADEPDLKS